MTRMTGPDCVVMCNLINTHTHTHTHTHRKTEPQWREGGKIGMTHENAAKDCAGETEDRRGVSYRYSYADSDQQDSNQKVARGAKDVGGLQGDRVRFFDPSH